MRTFRGMPIVGLDFETYYDKDYTLKKIDTPLYVTDERFHLWGVGINDCYYDNETDAFNALMAIDWSKTVLLCHNTAFDAYILNYQYGITPRFFMDTLSMARPIYKNVTKLGLDHLAKYLGFQGKTSDILARIKGKRDLSPDESMECGEYCLQDISEMWLLFDHLIPFFNDMELDLIDATIEMFATPRFMADDAKLDKEIDRILQHKESVFQGVQHLLPPDEPATRGEDIKQILRSPLKFAKTLEHNNIAVPKKVSPTTGKETYAFAKTDLGFKSLSDQPSSVADLLRKARLEAKSETEIVKVTKLKQYSKQCNTIPAFLNYSTAQTMRWSGKEIQLQNMGRDGEMRKSLIAPPGYRVGVVDSGQIEARCLAWFAEQDDLLDTIRQNDLDPDNNPDAYCKMASKIYGFPVTKANKLERFIGKVAVLGLGYGMSAEKFQITLAQGVMGPPVKVELEICQKVVNTYRQDNYKIKNIWGIASGWLSRMSSGQDIYPYKGISFAGTRIYSHHGMFLTYDKLRYDGNDNSYKYQSPKNGRFVEKYIYGALLIENIIQHISRNIIAEQLLNARKRYPLLLTVHDEGVFLLPEKEADEGMEFLYDVFTTAPKWCPDIPLSAEGGHAKNYSK